ncbi:MAG: hypothetical protein U5L96_15365 [Owenweeksia sp.]|nr:hypothetical protein [Owenweeksia sp.]
MKFAFFNNVGPAASYKGDGKSVTLTVPGGGFTKNFENRSASFELPTSLSIAGTYDFKFTNQRLSVSGRFQSNSFEKDRYTLGAKLRPKRNGNVQSGLHRF